MISTLKVDYTTTNARMRAVAQRDPIADGKFFYSVKSTGVYCRPSCASRAAKPENVEFHATAEDAEKAGYRPCLRCKPRDESLSDQHATTVASLCRFIERSEEEPSLQVLARKANMSTYHLHRIFKSVTGVTPKQYAVAKRSDRLRSTLRKGNSTITDAIYDAGYNSNSRFYSEANEILGMTPSAFKSGGARVEIRSAIGHSTVGLVLVAQSAMGICAILLGDDEEQLFADLKKTFPQATFVHGTDEFKKTVDMVVKFVDHPSKAIQLPLDIQGTAFQTRVWEELRKIPAGSTETYSSIAARIGNPKSTRAVARACGANHLAVAIPCHRVIGVDRKLTGYRWGIERKRKLLNAESAG
jgi:AraC family transcriptional regulator, regulatory protein of adaptative response / methylated-DNA-[protein]-cysteine methyltransferase